jgi:hypothetical protein
MYRARRYPRSLRQLLRPEPAVRTGAPDRLHLGQHTGQLFDHQQRAQAEASRIRVFADKLSEDLAKWAQRGGTNGSRRRIPATDWGRSDLVVAFADTSASSQSSGEYRAKISRQPHVRRSSGI